MAICRFRGSSVSKYGSRESKSYFLYNQIRRKRDSKTKIINQELRVSQALAFTNHTYPSAKGNKGTSTRNNDSSSPTSSSLLSLELDINIIVVSYASLLVGGHLALFRRDHTRPLDPADSPRLPTGIHQSTSEPANSLTRSRCKLKQRK